MTASTTSTAGPVRLSTAVEDVDGRLRRRALTDNVETTCGSDRSDGSLEELKLEQRLVDDRKLMVAEGIGLTVLPD